MVSSQQILAVVMGMITSKAVFEELKNYQFSQMPKEWDAHEFGNLTEYGSHLAVQD